MFGSTAGTFLVSYILILFVVSVFISVFFKGMFDFGK